MCLALMIQKDLQKVYHENLAPLKAKQHKS